MSKNALDPIKELANSVDMKLVNDCLAQTDLKDFEMTKQTILNISEWCLNGNSEREIAKKLSLNTHQWNVLLSVCPTLLIVMERSKQLAEVVLAGSLYQRAVGGKIVRKQQLVKVGDYENGVKIGEHIETHWVEEELPPEPSLLKYLAEKKLNEKLGENANKDTSSHREIIDNMSKEDIDKIKAMAKAGNLNG